jgi:hypothetical protein
MSAEEGCIATCCQIGTGLIRGVYRRLLRGGLFGYAGSRGNDLSIRRAPWIPHPLRPSFSERIHEEYLLSVLRSILLKIQSPPAYLGATPLVYMQRVFDGRHPATRSWLICTHKFGHPGGKGHSMQEMGERVISPGGDDDGSSLVSLAC